VIGILGIAFGISGPASTNAALDIIPGRIAAVSGVRQMFRQTGGTIGTAVAIFVISLFSDPSHGIQVMFAVLAIVILCIIPLVFMIPDTARQQRHAERRALQSGQVRT